MDKNKLELEKQNLVQLLNELNRKIDEYDIDEFWLTWSYFKDICNQKKKVLDQLDLVNKQIKQCED